tara:strand:- start:31 stop:315 length:285 start_codon:yes stop_codon:yes gene_type:complete
MLRKFTEKGLGFGGFFFRTKAPAALAGWHLGHTGADLMPQDSPGVPWMSPGLRFLPRSRRASLHKWLDDAPGIGKAMYLTDPVGAAVQLPKAIP